MEQPSKRLDSLIKGFPVELIQLILCELPDAIALRAAVLSHSVFYHAFVAAKDLIPVQVLINQIEPDLLPDAFAVLESLRIKPWSRERVQEFLAHYHENRLTPLPTWTMSEAVSASALYDDIAFFITDFAAVALAAHPVTGTLDISPPALTSDEKTRIGRTFYRFEIYCNCFRQYGWKDNRFRAEEQPEIFFDKYSPWENDQLACVHDYLYRRVLSVYNEFAAHDIEWGEEMVGYRDDDDWHDGDNTWKQGTLSFGLNYVRRLITAETYEERYRLLNPNRRSDWDSLHAGLWATNREQEDDDVELREYSKSYERHWIPPPRLDDPDPGPEKAWRWANQHESRGGWFVAASHRALRERGYVMWDLERLHKWDLFRAPWSSGPDVRFDTEKSQQEYEAMQRSWAERSKIYQRGGTGWWIEGDESRVVWKKDDPPRPRVRVINWP